MPAVPRIEPSRRDDLGRLANNYMLVQGVQNVLRHADTNLESVPEQFELLIEEEAWKEFLLPDGKIIRNPADFRQFVESPRPAGCQTPLHVLRHMVIGTPVADMVEKLLRGKPGVTSEMALAREVTKDPITGKFAPTENRHPVTVFGAPSVISMPTAEEIEKPKRKRDYSRESQQGNSVGYVMRRLERASPELFQQVKSGELSPTAAAIQAGFRDRTFTIPDNVPRAARILLKNFKREELAELIKLLEVGLK